MAEVDTDTSTCPACGQDTEVVLTQGDLRIRVDLGHHPDGNIVVSPDGPARVLTSVELPALVPARRDHRKTCPRGSHAARIAYATAPKCPACVQRHEPDPRMDPWLVEHGYPAHINCLPETTSRRTA